MTHSFRVLRFCAALVSFAAFLTAHGSFAHAADHLEAPGVMGANSDLDINDLYIFQSPNDANTAVLAMTVNPFAGGSGANLNSGASGTTFRAGASYEFQIDNNAAFAGTDLTYTATFGAAVMGTPQSFTLTRTQVTGALAGTSTTNVSPTGGTVGITGGGQVTAGVFDDPFFFDLVGFNNTLDPMSSATFTGTDTFAGANVSAIVFEVPIAQLTDGSTQVAVRAVTTDVLGNQVDQMGRPAINTALIPTGSKDAFNASDPADQLAMFGTDVEASLTALGAADPAGLTNVLLPDLLTVDFANPTTYLNGRGLTDDVMDATLNLVTNGAIPGDGVDVNMEGFQSVFPFLQVANVSAVPEPSSVALLLAASGGILVRRRKR